MARWLGYSVLSSAAVWLCAGYLALAQDAPLAMTVEEFIDAQGRPIIRLSGEVVDNSAGFVINHLQRSSAREIWLDSGGGDVAQAYEMGHYIRANGYRTRIISDAMCASACVDIFMGGILRTADPGARVMIHPGSISNTGGADLLAHYVEKNEIKQGVQFIEQVTTASAAEWSDYISFMGISKKLVEYAAQVRHDCVIRLNPYELKYFNLTNTD